MVQYLLFKSRNTSSTPDIIINPDTIDTSHTSVALIGQGQESYGQPQQQDILWMLENFAKSTAPAPAILGQEWFNLNDNQMYHCINESTQTFQKINKPIVSATQPSAGILTPGDLWYNTTDGRLYVLSTNGVTWTAIGPISTVPLSVEQQYYFNVVTSTATQAEMLLSGAAGSYLVIPTNTSWLFSIDLIGRAEENISEVAGFHFEGILDNPNAGAVNIVGDVSKTIYGITPSLQTPTTVDASVTADTSNNALGIYVTGQAGKTIQWIATVKLTIVTN